jgi:hypothetical protein
MFTLPGRADPLEIIVAALNATGAQAAQLLSDKIHGQADEFSKSAAGGMQAFHAQLGALEEKVGAGMLPALSAMVGGLSTAVDWVTTHWPEIEQTIGPVMDQVKQTIGSAISAAEAFWNHFGSTIKTQLADAVLIIKNALKVISDVFKIFGDLLRGDWGKLWSDLKALVGDYLNLIGAVIKERWDLVKGLMSTLGSMALHGLEAGLTGLGGLVSRAVGAGVDAIRGLVDDARHAAAQLGNAIVSGIVGGVSDLAKTLYRSVAAAVNFVLDKVNAVIRDINSALSFSVSIPGVDTHIPGVGKVGGVSFGFDAPDIPTIPGLDVGGLILQSGIAMVHKGETVVPAGAGGGGGVTNNYFTFAGAVGDKAAIQRWVVEAVVQANRTGTLRAADLR